MQLLNVPVIACICLGLLSIIPDAKASSLRIAERNKEKQQAESERAALRQKLSKLKRDISQTETAKSHAADALSQSETAISRAKHALRELAQEQAETNARLASLSKQQAQLNQKIGHQQNQLAELLRQQHRSGNEDRIKLLLSGDNPNRIHRDLHYMGYISEAQRRLIDSLKTDLQQVEQNKAEMQTTRDALAEMAKEEREHTAELEKEKARHATLLTQLSGKLAAQRREAGNIQRDEQRLSNLVGKLAELIAEQRKAELEQARQRRLAAEARRREQQKAMQVKLTPKPNAGSQTFPDPIDDDENPSKSLARNELEREAAVQVDAFSPPFSSLRGRLRLPVKGELLAKYGSMRGDGPSWKGLFIRAAEGADIKTVAAGRVVFADWLRGFGNLIIVDHGNQYMTIYGNNQALLKHAGDPVKAGDVIASAGNSGGNEQSGLYFEMRHQGRAFDPLGWVIR
ncbi:MAG: murein hydrolase activator EnvC family protein [Burkholderiaceae bacterium]